MNPRTAPNSGVRFGADSSTLLTYTVELTPSPWIVAASDQTVGTSALQILIANLGTDPVELDSINFSFPVGVQDPPGPSLLPGIGGITPSTSDSSVWSLSPTVSSGIATYLLAPKTTDKLPRLGPGDSLAIELSTVLTWSTPGTAPITVVELTGRDQRRGQTSFEVSTFPAGFLFDGLTASVFDGSARVPVAQVPAGTNVTLTWNSSVSAASGISILMATPSGQAQFEPDLIGEWTTPSPVTVDTVFTVVATAQVDLVSFTASQSIAVAVSQPALVAASLTADTVQAAAVTGAVITAADTTGSVTTITPGAVATGTVTASGTINAGALAVGAAITGGSLAVTGDVGADVVNAASSVNTTTLRASYNADSVTVNATWIGATSGLGMPAITSMPSMSVMRIQPVFGSGTSFRAPTDGFALAYITPTGDSSKLSAGTVTVSTSAATITALGTYISPTGTSSNVAMPGYVNLPVASGDTVTWSFAFLANVNSEPQVAFWFAGLGSALIPT